MASGNYLVGRNLTADEFTRVVELYFEGLTVTNRLHVPGPLKLNLGSITVDADYSTLISVGNGEGTPRELERAVNLTLSRARDGLSREASREGGDAGVQEIADKLIHWERGTGGPQGGGKGYYLTQALGVYNNAKTADRMLPLLARAFLLKR